MVWVGMGLDQFFNVSVGTAWSTIENQNRQTSKQLFMIWKEKTSKKDIEFIPRADLNEFDISGGVLICVW